MERASSWKLALWRRIDESKGHELPRPALGDQNVSTRSQPLAGGAHGHRKPDCHEMPEHHSIPGGRSGTEERGADSASEMEP
jgi:hypothetical protein